MLASLLGLPRPLILFDLETTGVDPEVDRIVQLSMRVHKQNGEIHPYQTLINPGIAIPESSTRAHGITDDMIKNGCARCKAPTESHPWERCDQFRPVPKFADLATNLYRGFSDADFGGYNVRFDLRVIVKEFSRLQLHFDTSQAKIIDGFRFWQILETRTLSDAVEYFLRRKHKGAHDATADIAETEAVMIAQLTSHPNSSRLPRSIRELHDLCFPGFIDLDGKFIFIDGEPCFNFGKHRGEPMRKNREYLDWMVRKGNFSAEVRRIAINALAGNFPQLTSTTPEDPAF